MPVSGLVRAEAVKGPQLWTFQIHLAAVWRTLTNEQKGIALRQAATALETWAEQMREEAVEL